MKSSSEAKQPLMDLSSTLRCSALLCTAKAPHSDFHSTALGSRLVVVLQLTDTTLQAKVSQALELSLPSFLPSFRRQKGLRTDPCLGTPIPAFAVE